MIHEISILSGLSESKISEFFETWSGFYDIDNGISAEDAVCKKVKLK